MGHNGRVNERKFLNQAQPQTLVLGTLLLYINAVFGLLFGVISTSLLLGLARPREVRRPRISLHRNGSGL